MKRLIILTLLVPMMCFANESESMSLQEEAQSQNEVSEMAAKLESLRRVQTAVETARATEAVQASEAIEESEPHWIRKVWAAGAIWFLALAASVSILYFFVMAWRCIRFNYHYYIEYGDYRLGWVLENGERSKVVFISNKLNYDIEESGNVTDFMETSWFGFLAMWLLGSAVMVLGAIVWPITLIVLGPNLLTELIAHRPRKKKIFEKKLKGEMKNGTV